MSIHAYSHICTGSIHSKVSALEDVAWTYGFHPRSFGLTKRIPARDTVAGVAALTWPISNISLMEGVRGTRSLLARVITCVCVCACVCVYVHACVHVCVCVQVKEMN